nr:type II toxin-antitoxin system prevent-host-death family antitoxin [uncultured Duganella sp.]
MPKNIQPISFLMTNANDVVKQAQDSQEPVMITVAGKVQVIVQDIISYQKMQAQLTKLRITQPYAVPAEGRRQRLGFMAGQITVPDDFDRIGSNEIEQLFKGDS